uniref:NADP-dependent oxidoreductase domain-containing protein n=1 Tax=Timema genevievae TaxID=629358 RepID=A0A7R9K9S3_TIMGE|nr:unnamed protein product [Timema genevievae]
MVSFCFIVVSIGCRRERHLRYFEMQRVHDIEFAPNLEYVFTQTLPVLQEAIKEGKARYLGVTGYPVSILQRAVESSPIKIHVVLSYCRNTLIDDSLSEIIPSLQAGERALGSCGRVGVEWDDEFGEGEFRGEKGFEHGVALPSLAAVVPVMSGRGSRRRRRWRRL